MNKHQKQDQCNVFERNGQLVFAINSEILLPENAPVRLTSAQLEELNYDKLYSAYSAYGRKPAVDPRVMFKVMVYGYQCGIYSTRELEEACRYRIDFMWLLEDEPIPDHSTISRFRKDRCIEAAADLFYQYVKLLEENGETDHKAVFIDGTKIESCAGRYTFCWRGRIEKQLEKVKTEITEKLGKITLKQLQEYLDERKEDIVFVSGKGHHKSAEQKDWERLNDLCQRWMDYETSLKIMREDRNSYSKTDPDATFMRMKEDHMRNGQLKPAYNVQLAVNSEYITGVDVFSNRSDHGTLIPFLNTLQRMHLTKYEEVTADAGYESLDNYLYLEDNEQLSFIKPVNYEAQKTRKFKKQIGRIENMEYHADEDYFVCAQGRKLPLLMEHTEERQGHIVTTAVYRCENCKDCPCRQACCRAKDPEEPKQLRLQREFQEKRAESQANITTLHGIHLRMCRSIQVEGAFALLKNDFGFRRFLTKGSIHVRVELFFLSLAFNLKKLWMKREHNRLKTHLTEIKIT